jgi:hypothetical protein
MRLTMLAVVLGNVLAALFADVPLITDLHAVDPDQVRT